MSAPLYIVAVPIQGAPEVVQVRDLRHALRLIRQARKNRPNLYRRPGFSWRLHRSDVVGALVASTHLARRMGR